jgi:hypothetical protein
MALGAFSVLIAFICVDCFYILRANIIIKLDVSKFARVCIFLLIYPDEDCVFFTIFALDGMRSMAYGQPSDVRTHFGTVFANLYLQGCPKRGNHPSQWRQVTI